MSGIYPKPKHNREQRVEILLKMLKERGEQPEEVILAKFCYEEHVSTTIAREYLNILKLAGKLNATT